MEKTISKNFYDIEIKGVMYLNGKKVIYLKSGVKRLWRFTDHILESKMDHINYHLIYKDKYERYYKEIVGSEDNT